MCFKRLFLIIFATFFFLFLPKQQSLNYIMAASDPGAYVMEITEKTIQKIEDIIALGEDEEEDDKNEKKAKNKKFDIPSISRFVLCKYWKQASLDQKKNFIKAFRNYVVKTYSSRFNEYSGEQLTLINFENESNPKIFIVLTALKRKDAPPIIVDWRIGKKKENFVILDIIIEGISLAITQRSEFVSVIDQNEGNIDQLISILKEKT